MDCKNVSSLNATHPTSAPSIKNDPQHCFFMVNDVLCRTETADGSFRPSDIFVGYSPPSEAFPEEDDTGCKDESNISNNSAGVDLSDCVVFNTFGILSGGVLMDPESAFFLDFTDDIVIAPAVSSTGESSTRQKNNAYYRSMSYSKIRSEAVLCLCSSIEPFNARGSERAPLSWPRCASYMSTPSDAHRLAQQSVNRTICKCATHAVENTDLLSFLEYFRFRVKQKHTQSNFLPSSIAFGLQYGGKPFDAIKPTAVQSSMRETTSRYSDFCAYSAISKECHNSKSTLDERRTTIELRVQQLLRPLRREFGKHEKALYKTKSKLWNLWYTFHRYFGIMGVRRGGPCSASDPSAVVTVDRHRGHPSKDQGPPPVVPCISGTTAWILDEDIKISYADVVDACEGVNSVTLNKDISRKALTSEASDAWHWLLNHDRTRFLHRVKKVQRYAERHINAKRKASRV